ncbi:UDP-N-acetylbacillosamine N-acetyltransferase [Campylobacter sp.]|uniref:UDP-N-acetylbacillosamine N-acetyltransferase n=1 Tax=Campylobacter sp. TaxID=205 RepID=UPI001B23BB0F|nr:UDP-N-acetylbacillosamine N-acetyltransferase [Campylobacter sp.]MBE6429693.1 UDP-N-acetylbacillosamine N-acetyltransferase [Campylobacter sp.]MBO5063093.1 UDP-N-acetylbacillosamine N-acetyltransferase [Campylobacter sp.]MBQ8820607.1 UDP-N-acetylbacillosamine N-acetyltransferase [Campylobacter sp.]
MATTSLYIYGNGGHAKVVADIARANGYDNLIFLDDNSDMKFNSNLPKHPIIIAIGNALIRQKLQNLVLSSGFELITLIHPTAVIGSDVTIGNGSVVMPGAIINAKSTIGNGVIINSGAIIEHECTIGDFAHICPGVAIAGGSLVGERSWIGIGSSVIQNITIKPDITIGAGSVVVKDILEGSLAYGNPCRVVKS